MKIDNLVEIRHCYDKGISAVFVGCHIEGPSCNEVVVLGFLILYFGWGAVAAGLTWRKPSRRKAVMLTPVERSVLLGDESSDFQDESLGMCAGIL